MKRKFIHTGTIATGGLIALCVTFTGSSMTLFPGNTSEQVHSNSFRSIFQDSG